MFRRLGWYWRCCWGLVTPVGLAAILCYSLASYQPVAYSNLQLQDRETCDADAEDNMGDYFENVVHQDLDRSNNMFRNI